MPNSDDRLAVFDFCETLADFQTANAFVDFVRQHTSSFGLKMKHLLYVLSSKSQLINLLNILTGHRHSIGKLIKLRELRGLPQTTVEELALRFYTERVEPHLIDVVVEEMQRLKHEGYKVGLSSGGYDIYLKHFVQAYGLDFCQCSELAFRNGRCTGKLVGADCMRKEKVKRLTAVFGLGTNAVAFSDSLSDLPLMQWAARSVVVSHGKHQIWGEQYHFEEIIW